MAPNPFAPEPAPDPLGKMLVRAAVSAVLIAGAGAALAMTMGVTAMSAVLFATACGLISVITSYI